MPDPTSDQEWLSQGGIDPLRPSPGSNPLSSTGSDAEWLADGARQAQKQFNLSQQMGAQKDPEAVARVWKLRAKTGLPPELIERNLDRIEWESKQKDFDPVEFRKKSPIVSGWIAEHPDHASLAAEDLDQLGTMEALITGLGGGFQTGRATNQLGRVGNRAMLGLDTEQDRVRISELERQINSTPGGDGFIGQWLVPTSKFIGQMFETATDSVDEALVGAAAGAVAGAVVSAPTAGAAAPITATGGALVGLKVGFVSGLITNVFETESGLAYLEMKKIRGANGEEIDDDTAAAAAVGVGTINAALEAVGARAMVAPFKAAANRFLADATKEELARPTARAAMVQLGKDWATAVGTETATEVTQEFVNIVGEELAKMASAGEFESLVDSPEERAAALDRLIEIASETFRGTALLGVPGAGINFAGNMREVKQAQAREQAFMALGDTTAKSKLVERSSDATRELIEKMTADGPVEKLYIPAEQWVGYWQSQNVDPREMAEEITGDAAGFDQAVETGGDIAIPTASYASRIAPTKHHAAFVPELRTEPGQMNGREAKEFLEQVEQQRQAQQVSPEEEQRRQFDDSALQVRQQVVEQLKASGIEGTAAEQYGALYGSVFRSLSDRSGASPLEMFQRYGLNIAREDAPTDTPTPTDVRRLDQGPVDLGPEGRQVEQRFAERLALPDAEQAYAALPDTKGGKILNVDTVRDLSADYAASKESRAKFAPATHEPASRFIKDQYKKRLAKPAAGPVAFLAGGGGSGKGYVQENAPKVAAMIEAAEIGRDGVMSDAAKAIQYIDQVLESGRAVDYIYVHQPFARAVAQAKAREKRIGRSVPLDVLAEAHAGAQDALFKVAAHYADNPNVRVHVFDNSGSTPREMSVAELATQRYDQDGKGVEATAERLLQEVANEVQPRPRPDDAGGAGTVPEGQPSAAGDAGSAQAGEQAGVQETSGADADRVLNQGENDKKQPRGQFRVNRKARRFNIALFKNADLSTFLHESGHFYLEVLGDIASGANASEQVKADYASLLKWFGVESRDQIENRHHEQFARGFEAYLMEGKAPSAELRSTFARFRAWLVSIYKTVAGLRISLNDEVRGVMDRLVATDEQIAAAEGEAEVAPAFATAKDAGMSDEEFAAYRKTVERASAAARENLQQKLIREMEREQKAWWKEEKAKVRAEVEAEVNQRKEYIALSVLTTGTMPDGSALPDGMTAVKIDRKATDKNDRKRLPKGITSDTGVSPDTAADLFGFSTGDDLLTSLERLPPKEKTTSELTDQRMRERHGDLMSNQARMIEAARDAISGTEREKVVHAELRALRRLQREAAPVARQQAAEARTEERAKADARVAEVRQQNAEKRAADVENRRNLFTRVPDLEAVRAQARATVARMQVKDINPYQHWVAARQAARKAFRAVSTKKYDEAAAAKAQELLSLELYRAATDAKAEADKASRYLRGFQKDAVRGRIAKAGQDYLDQIDALLDRFEFVKMSQVQLEARKQALSEWINEKQANGETLGEEIQIPPQLVNEANKKHYTKLTVEELVGLRDAVKQIAHLASQQNQLLADEKAEQKDVARAEMIEAAEGNLGDKGPPPLTKAGLTTGQKIGGVFQELDASLIKMETLIDWLDGGKIDGPWRRYLFTGASKAQSAELDYTEKITAKIAKLVTNIPKSVRSRMLERVTIPGIDRAMTRRDIIGVALNVGNESNYDKLLRGMQWTEGQVQAMLDQLTAEEIAFVNGVHETLESMWPDIAALQRELTGLEPEKIDPRPKPARNGTIKGGYYPLMYDPLASETGGLQLASAVGGLIEQGYTRATTPKGHTKARVQGFTAPFDLDIDRLPLHIAGVVKDLTHRKWLMDANWIVNDRQIMSTVRRRLGDAYVNLFKDWVRGVVNDRSHGSMRSLSIWRRMLEHFRFNVMIAGMGFKAATMASQIAGIGPSVEVLKARHGAGAKRALAHAYAEFVRHPRKTYNFVVENSGEMRHRIDTRDRDLRDKLRLLQGRTDPLAEIQRVSLHGIVYADMSVSVPTWKAAYDLTFAETQDKSLAIEAGDRAVRMSQGSGGQKDLSAVAASRDWLRLITMFYTPFSALYSRLRDIGRSVKSPKDIPQAFIRSWWVWVLPAVMGELLAGRGPDDDEGWDEWFLRTAGAYPFMAVPGGRDVVNGVVSDYGYSFSPIVSVGKATTQAIDTVGGVITGDRDLEDLAADTFKASKYWLGLPVGQIEITGGYLLDLLEGEEDPDDLGEFTHDLLYRRRE